MYSARRSSRFPKEPGIVQRTRQRLRALDSPPRHVLVACSGGRDSVALTAVLAELRRLGLFDLTIAHIHHGQHAEADVAAESVDDIGKQLGVPVAIRHLDRDRIAAHTDVGLEEALRRERYLALAEMAQQYHADCVALAHHQRDQAETVLLHLLRGAGIQGLAGMRTWDVRAIPWWDRAMAPITIALWRPFLAESSAEVAETAARAHLPIAEDPTNTDEAFRRNAIRHRALPLLEEIAAGSTASIARTASALQRDRDIIAAAVDDALRQCRSGRDLRRDHLAALPLPLGSAVVRAWLQDEGYGLDLTMERVDAIFRQAQGHRTSARIEVGGGISVRLYADVLSIEPESE